MNRIAVAGIAAQDIARMREILLAVIENLARDEAQPGEGARRVPSTRELARLVAGGPRARRARA